jgi:hypothetical protein
VTVELIRAPELAQTAPYAYAAVADDVRRLVFTAGACPLDEDGGTVAVGDVTGQAEQVMANLRAARCWASPFLATPTNSSRSKRSRRCADYGWRRRR